MIEINGLYKSYTDEEEVVKDIHMKGEKGTIHGLIGHNGLVLPGLSLRQGYLVQPFAAFRQGLFSRTLDF